MDFVLTNHLWGGVIAHLSPQFSSHGIFTYFYANF